MSDVNQELDLVLRSMRDEELPEAALRQVRECVQASIRERRQPRVHPVWLWAAAAMAALLFALAPQLRFRNEQLVVRATAPPPPEFAWQAAPRAVAPRLLNSGGSRVQVRHQPIEEATEFMRIVTDDPNVVILWALNSKGETR